MCGEKATLCIKDTSDYYCKECADENFNDISYLVKVEEEAKALKKVLDEALDEKDLNNMDLIKVNIKKGD